MVWEWLTYLGWQSKRQPTFKVEKRIVPADKYELSEVPGKGYVLSLDERDIVFKDKRSVIKYIYKRLKT